MSEVGKELGDGGTNAGGAINRRRLLKGAAAAGVGAAVWTAPNIKTLGATPAYASHTATTAVPTPISDSTTLNANCSNPACPFSAEWGNSGNPGKVKIKPPAAIKTACGLAANDRIIVDVLGCVGSMPPAGGTAKVLNLTQNGVSLTGCGYCCQVSEIFVSTSGNSGPYTAKNATGACDPKTFDPTASVGSCSYFLRASIICLPNAPGDCCP